MKLIDDLKAAAKACLEDGSGGCDHYRFENAATPKVILLLCEAVEALDGVVEQDFWDFLDADGREVEARNRASAILDKIRSYAT